MKQKERANILMRLAELEQAAKGKEERQLQRFLKNAPTELLRRLVDDLDSITEEEFQAAFRKYSSCK